LVHPFPAALPAIRNFENLQSSDISKSWFLAVAGLTQSSAYIISLFKSIMSMDYFNWLLATAFYRRKSGPEVIIYQSLCHAFRVFNKLQGSGGPTTAMA
jgi:hypothetical protein